MIRHTVAFRLKHVSGSTAERDFLKSACELGRIEGVQKFECLRQTSLKNGFSFGLSMEFADEAAYAFYCGHPEHVGFVQERWIPEVEEFMELDYVTYGV
jgi:stress responsive alpha/beta barrel protein